MKATILTEGGKRYGFGHVSRCCALSEAFQIFGIDTTMLIKGDASVEGLLDNIPHDFKDWESPEHLLDIVSSDIVILDSYHASEAFYTEIAKNTPIKLFFDDFKRIKYPKGILLNGALKAERLYPEGDGTNQYLLGAKYSPLRKVFWGNTTVKINDNIEHILITLGGSQTQELVLEIVTSLSAQYPNKKINVLSTPKPQSIEFTNVSFLGSLPPASVKEQILSSDLVISACGQTIYELAKLGVPTIALVIAKNQLENAMAWKETGFIYYAGISDNFPKATSMILKGVDYFKTKEQRKKNALNGPVQIDGKGAIRIVRHCLNRLFEKNISLKKADYSHIWDVYNLSNSPDVRRSSFEPKKISKEEHQKWFGKKLESASCLFLVFFMREEFLAQVRFDIQEKDAVISISSINKYHGTGLGSVVIQKSLEALKSEFPKLDTINAFIKTENKASIAFFQKNAFQFDRETSIHGQKSFVYKYIY